MFGTTLNLVLAKSRADRDMRLPNAILAIDLGMAATKSSIIYLPASTPKTDVKPISVTFEGAARSTGPKDPKDQAPIVHTSIPTMLSYNAAQMSWDAGPAAVGHDAMREDMMEDYDIYKHFKISALRDPRGRVASTNGRSQREGGQLLQHFLAAIHPKIENFFNQNRPSSIPLWYNATIHIVLSAPPQAGATGTDALHSLATKVFASPTHTVWPVSLSEPEAASYYVAGEVRMTQPRLPKTSTLLVADLGGGTSDLALVYMKKKKAAIGTGFIKPVISMHRGGAHVDKSLAAMVLRVFQKAEDYLLEGVTPERAAYMVTSSCDFLEIKPRFSAGFEHLMVYNLKGLAKSAEVREVLGVSISRNYLLINRRALHRPFDEQISGTPTRPAIVEHLLDMRGDLYAGAPLAAQAKMSTKLDSFVFVGGFGSSTYVQDAVRSALERNSCTANAALHGIMSDTVFPKVAHPQLAVVHGLAMAHHLLLLHKTRPSQKALVVPRYMFV
ncbi:hypothetical protein MAPG_02074 [Magnaporthiopsis poae ATCC 64411]|uniref:Hsp70-like protein n=1 Tax=Magnaporthiopsis poae (strain ATCC 64411 / 73-15) TaxID=644358 RepID=A0A0C4DQD5_MAGP6|nr:hypothetical protein MAPG_02074 [Magnaporthiopsis poae ATCC 64411]